MNIDTFKNNFNVVNTSQLRGYSDEEILTIEKLYDIEVRSELFYFPKELG